jgi:tRNA (mo5U34)-methyltransferase
MPHIRAKDPACVEWNRMLMEEYNAKGFYHSIELPDGRVLEGILTLDHLRARLAEFPIQRDLSGKRVLDIGAWDGYFAFEMEKRGAEVMAIDNTEVANFYVAHQLLNSKVDYRVMDVYELAPERVGRFDIVLFLGVLYHLKHPLYALERVCEVTREMAIVESFVTNEAVTSEMPTLEFYETDELLGQIDNWCGPNAQCLLAFCRTAGFARANLIEINRQRALVACYRHWEPEPVRPTAAAPRLNAATHSANYGINLNSKKDEYLAAFFKSEEHGLALDDVMPEVSGFGVRPVAVVHHGGDGWQANFKLPPGLDPGWHEVRLRTVRSRYSNPVRIAVDVPPKAENLSITGACDGKTWTPGEVQSGDDAYLSVWVAGLPENADRHNVQVRLNGRKLQLHELIPAQGDEPRQINLKLGAGAARGVQALVVAIGGAASAPFEVRVK